jgi:hypothetical protein
MLVWVRAPHYCAGLVIGRKHLSGGVLCLEAAPILRWSLGKSWLELKSYFARKRFEVVLMVDPAVKT